MSTPQPPDTGAAVRRYERFLQQCRDERQIGRDEVSTPVQPGDVRQQVIDRISTKAITCGLEASCGIEFRNFLRDEFDALAALPSEVEQELRVSAAMIEDLQRQVQNLANDRLVADADAAQLRADLDVLRSAWAAEFARERLPVKHLDVAFASPPAPSGWQPIESAPKNGHEIIVFACETVGAAWWCRANDSTPAQWRWSGSGWRAGAINRQPTHWMPLPPAPGATDPITAAVHADLAPLADALIEAGHKYAKGLSLDELAAQQPPVTCPTCGAIDAERVPVDDDPREPPEAGDPVDLMKALRKGLENALKAKADASPVKETLACLCGGFDVVCPVHDDWVLEARAKKASPKDPRDDA